MCHVSLGISASRSVVVSQTGPAYVESVQVAGRASAEAAERALERIFERFPEVSIKISVDQRIKCRVEVSDPEEDGYDHIGRVAWVPTERCDYVPQEERQPTENKCSHYNTKCPRCFVLALHFNEVSIFGRGRVEIGGVVEGKCFRRAAAGQDVAVVLVVEQHHVAVALMQLLLLPVRLLEDGEVGENHDRARNPEAYGRRYDGKHPIHFEFAHFRIIVPELLVLSRGVPSEEDGYEADERRRDPRIDEHHPHHLLGHIDRILERLNYSVVPINANTTQMEYAGSGEVHVEAVPHVAHEITKHPLAGNLHAKIKRHGHDRDKHIGKRERHDEIIRDDPQLAMPHHRNNHEQIAENRGYDYRAHYRDFQQI